MNPKKAKTMPRDKFEDEAALSGETSPFPPERDGEQVNSSAYLISYLITQTLGVALLILLLVWTLKYLGGLNFTTGIFNFHPLFMVLGLVFFFSNSMLIYRSLREKPKKQLKILHASLNGLIVGLVILALWAVIHSKEQGGRAHLYSLHSWLGVVTCLLFVCQFIAGFTVYLLPCASVALRKASMPYHRFLGVTIFLVACATTMTGISGRASGIPDYSSYPFQGIMVNLMSLVLVTFATLTVFLVARGNFKRTPLPTD